MNKFKLFAKKSIITLCIIQCEYRDNILVYVSHMYNICGYAISRCDALSEENPIFCIQIQCKSLLYQTTSQRLSATINKSLFFVVAKSVIKLSAIIEWLVWTFFDYQLTINAAHGHATRGHMTHDGNHMWIERTHSKVCAFFLLPRCPHSPARVIRTSTTITSWHIFYVVKCRKFPPY